MLSVKCIILKPKIQKFCLQPLDHYWNVCDWLLRYWCLKNKRVNEKKQTYSRTHRDQ